MKVEYFNNPKTLAELKKQYKELAKKYHPDINSGISDIPMKKINNEYEYLFNIVPKNAVEQEEESFTYPDIIEKIIHLPNIEIEICGSWIWISGKTREVKEQLKDAGFLFAPKKIQWYYRPATYQKKSRKTLSMEQIRNLYGSDQIQGKEREKIAVYA